MPRALLIFRQRHKPVRTIALAGVQKNHHAELKVRVTFISSSIVPQATRQNGWALDAELRRSRYS